MNQSHIKILPGILEYGFRTYPRRNALIFGQKNYTYEDIYRKALAIASTLKNEGIRKQDRVALLLDNSPDFILYYYGILMSEGIVVAINHMFKRDEIRHILEDSGSTVLITSSTYGAIAQELQVIVDFLKKIIFTNQTTENQEPPINVSGNETPAGSPESKKNENTEDIAVFLYTSGTTGHPKAACLSHKNLLANIRSSSAAIRLTPKDTLLCFLPLFHSFAATVCMHMPLYNGAQIVILKSPRPLKKLLRSIQKNRVTIFVGIPSIYNILKDIKLPAFLPRPILRFLNPVRVAISGAAALPVEVFKKFEKKFGIPLLEGYGLTEASPVVSLNPLKGKRKPGSIGVPIPGVSTKIIDTDGESLGPEQIGELCVKGDNIMQGYYKKEEDNKVTLKNGWLLTGDMAKIDNEGYLFIMGRKKEMVNVRGLNVYPREIEEVLYQDPRIKEAAVIGIPDPHKGETPKGFVVLKTKGSMTEHEIIAYLRERLAPYKIPKKIEIREELPKNASGKILKNILVQKEKEKNL